MPRPDVTQRTALIGFGVSGAVLHGPLISATSGLDLVAIVTSDPDRRSAAAAGYPEAAILPDLRALWDEHVDLVVVATPSSSHAAIAEQVIAAGIAVVVEKPLAVSSATAGRLVARASRVALPGSQQRN